MTAAFEQAREAARHGHPVFPVYWIIDGRCACGKATCNTPGKHPLTRNGITDATTAERQLLHWDARLPDANWALAAVLTSVVDIDTKAGGDPVEVVNEHDLADRPRVRTGAAASGPLEGDRGEHVYCAPGARTGRTTTTGVEVRGDPGGYVLLPGSRHASGVAYEWATDQRPWSAPLQPIPVALQPLPAGTGTQPAPAAGRVPHGQRHPHLTDFAVRLVRAGVTDQARMLAHLRCEFEIACEPLPAPKRGYFEGLATWAVGTRMADRERNLDKLLGHEWARRGL